MTVVPKPSVSPFRLREEVEKMILNEPLGPGSGDEKLVESPGTRYFVGVLAPRQRAKGNVAPGPVSVAEAKLA